MEQTTKLMSLNTNPEILFGVDFKCTARKPIFSYENGKQEVVDYEDIEWFSFNEIEEQLKARYVFDICCYQNVSTMKYMIQARANELKDYYNGKFLSFTYEVDPENNYEMFRKGFSNLNHGHKVANGSKSKTDEYTYPDGTSLNRRHTGMTEVAGNSSDNTTTNSGDDKTTYEEYTHGDMSVRSLPSVLKEMRDFLENIRKEYIDEFADLFILVM